LPPSDREHNTADEVQTLLDIDFRSRAEWVEPKDSWQYYGVESAKSNNDAAKET
jgi:hypothetical protein